MSKIGKNNLFCTLILILTALTDKSYAMEAASQPIEMELFSFCLQDICEVSIIMENKTGFQIELITPLVNNRKYSDQAVEFYKSEEVYTKLSPFDNPIKVSHRKFIPLNDNVTFSPLEKKSYKIRFDKQALGLIKGTEYVVLGAMIKVGFIIEGNNIRYMSLVSKPGNVMEEWE
jgi:hypothetical protein